MKNVINVSKLKLILLCCSLPNFPKIYVCMFRKFFLEKYASCSKTYFSSTAFSTKQNINWLCKTTHFYQFVLIFELFSKLDQCCSVTKIGNLFSKFMNFPHYVFNVYEILYLSVIPFSFTCFFFTIFFIFLQLLSYTSVVVTYVWR